MKLLNPWVILAALAGLAIYTTVIVRASYNEGKTDCEFANQAAIIAEQQRQAAVADKIANADSAQAVADKEKEDELEDQLAAIPDDTSCGISGAAADRLRQL